MFNKYGEIARRVIDANFSVMLLRLKKTYTKQDMINNAWKCLIIIIYTSGILVVAKLLIFRGFHYAPNKHSKERLESRCY
ncbi:hypothetical protein VIN01S_32290 [Vibrio inusitatus NBRC 102082]|uniref:Uncharacterized protein n=1 Tax=Vibrio inusitatus NBRC 102082 TaxID=1219070 RepID=A0A4Y3HZF2_9VIBR|nr:hypothetical protein VIN01S_32290 [Vibrio inusitatus NBRC 102082]